MLLWVFLVSIVGLTTRIASTILGMMSEKYVSGGAEYANGSGISLTSW